MKLTNLGQAGVMAETGGKTIFIDPYFSDAVGETMNPNMHRRVPMDKKLMEVDPDVVVFTHDHLDHYDPETAEKLLGTGKSKLVFAPRTAWEKARRIGGGNNCVMVEPGVRWAEEEVDFQFVRAVHSDPYAVGVMIYAEGKTLYITGDTLFSDRILEEIGDDVDVDYLFLPINGVGNNMNETDAAFFAESLGAKHVIPMHVGLLDDKNTDSFECEGKTVLPIYGSLVTEE